MSKVSEEYLKIIREIGEHISNEEERKYVLDKVSELSSLYIVFILELFLVQQRCGFIGNKYGL